MCNPKDLTRQLHESLDRLGTDYADLYMMHRDNLDIPVGEFIDVLNEHKSAGRIKAFGGSNWSIPRVQAANDYAKANGKTRLLRRQQQLQPRAHGRCRLGRLHQRIRCRIARVVHAKRSFPLLAWSSQSRGFFLPGRAAPDKREDAELVRCWYSDDNFRRLERVNEMAKKRNVLPINIALAYVLNQPFPTFALIGPRLLSETRTSLPALDIELSPADLKWLNLES